MLGDAIAGLLGKVLDRVWQDPAQKAQAAQALAELQQAGEFKQIDALLKTNSDQVQINIKEAESDSLFKSGWRPFIGWICGTAFAWNFVGISIARFVLTACGHPVDLPLADMGEMMPVLLGMLGLGGLRTMERLQGKA